MRLLATLLIASSLAALPASAQSATHQLVTGNDWQKSSLLERRAYLIGVSNAISVGASYDARLRESDTFALHAQKGLSGSQIDAAVSALDAWYRANPTQLDKPVLSVLWREIAKRQPLS